MAAMLVIVGDSNCTSWQCSVSNAI